MTLVLEMQSDQAPIPSPVLAQMQAILSKDAQADRIALVWPEPIEPAEYVRQISDTALRFVYCPSELAIRERLVRHDLIGHEGGRERLVLLSPFDETRLAKDVLARLWGHEPKRISPWRTLEQLLHVHQIDPRLTGKEYRWIAECLVSTYDRYKARIQFGEVLDFEKAWRALALGLLDFSGETVDLDALLEWSRIAGAADAVAAMPDAVKEHLGDWLEPRLGEQTRLVQSLWLEGHAGDMLAIGLVCFLLYRTGQKSSQALFQARGRLTERFLGADRIEDSTLRAFGITAASYVERALRRREYGEQRSDLNAALSFAEQLLASLDLMPLSVESDLLPGGFGLRLDRFATALNRSIGGKSMNTSLDALVALKRHELAKVRKDQLRTAELAMRICQWLQTDEAEPATANAEIRDYVDSGGYLDWARSRLWAGDEHEALSGVYKQLTNKVSERRERLNQRFSRHLPAIARGDELGETALPVERALNELVAPLAKQQPVLVLVLDGMSQAVYRELTNDLSRYSWVELQREGDRGPGCLLAALPTITRISRYSLLAGSLGEGSSGDEKKAFVSHPALKTLSSTKFPPLLFHKSDLQQTGSGALADQVREVIADHKHRIVGAVINAVDDQLSSGAQLSVNWSVESIGLLRQILEAARDSGRLVIFTSDHGHVLDHDMQFTKAPTDAERFKDATATAGSGEVVVEGKRVLLAGRKVILPWSERIRYTPKKMGYHGGGTPQEVVIPFGVYRSAGETDPVEGWREVPRQKPAWWSLEAAEGTLAEDVREPPVKVRKMSKQDHRTLDLFAEAAQSTAPLDASADWISALFASPRYAQMKLRVGRAKLAEDQVRRLLVLLEDGGGRQMTGALVQALGIPSIRMNGFLAGVQKLLNVDGYPVLSIDRVTRTVKLNVESLKTQFEL